MPRAFLIESNTASNLGPRLIGAGLAIVLAAQLWPAIPLAAAISLIGVGATLTLEPFQNPLLLALNWVIYASLVAMAIAAQMDLHSYLLTRCDAVVAIILIFAAIRR